MFLDCHQVLKFKILMWKSLSELFIVPDQLCITILIDGDLLSATTITYWII